MQLLRPHPRLHRNHPEGSSLIVLAEVAEEAESELLSAADPGLLIVGLWPCC